MLAGQRERDTRAREHLGLLADDVLRRPAARPSRVDDGMIRTATSAHPASALEVGEEPERDAVAAASFAKFAAMSRSAISAGRLSTANATREAQRQPRSRERAQAAAR